MGEEKFQRLDIRHGHIHHVAGFPADEIGGRDPVDGVEEMHPHFGQNAVSTLMGKHAFQIAAQGDQGGAKHRQCRVDDGSPTIACRGQQPQGAEAHQPHVRQCAENAGQGGNYDILSNGPANGQQPAVHFQD